MTREQGKSKGERTKARILDAAEHEFAQRGLSGARLAQVATAAECRTTLIHHYFGDKQSLYEAVVVRVSEDVQREVGTMLQQMEALVIPSKVFPHAQHRVLSVVRAFVGALRGFYQRHGAMVMTLERDPSNAEVFHRATQVLFESAVTRLEMLQDAQIVSNKNAARDVCLFTLSRVCMSAMLPRLFLPLEGETHGEASHDPCVHAVMQMLTENR